MPNNISIGSLISSRRKEKNMTQNDLALKLNVTDKAVSKWERDICFPDVALLPEIAEILDLNLEDLILGRKKTSSNLFDLVLAAVSFAMGTAVFASLKANVGSVQDFNNTYFGLKERQHQLAQARLNELKNID